MAKIGHRNLNLQEQLPLLVSVLHRQAFLRYDQKLPSPDNLSVFFSNKIISHAHKARLQAKPQSGSFRSILFLVNKVLLKSGATGAGAAPEMPDAIWASALQRQVPRKVR